MATSNLASNCLETKQNSSSRFSLLTQRRSRTQGVFPPNNRTAETRGFQGRCVTPAQSDYKRLQLFLYMMPRVIRHQLYFSRQKQPDR